MALGHAQGHGHEVRASIESQIRWQFIPPGPGA